MTPEKTLASFDWASIEREIDEVGEIHPATPINGSRDDVIHLDDFVAVTAETALPAVMQKNRNTKFPPGLRVQHG